MDIKLKKDTIKLNETIFYQRHEKNIENDIIVPDIKPDIKKIIEVTAQAHLHTKTIEQGSISLVGEIHVNVIYLADTEITENLKSMSAHFPFNISIDAKDATPAMFIFAESQIKSLAYNLLHSRKISIKLTLFHDVKLISKSNLQIATDTDEEAEIQTNYENFNMLNTTDEIVKEFTLSYTIDIPSEKPDVYEILKINTPIATLKKSVSAGHIDIKGTFSPSIIYTSYESEEIVHLFSKDFEFDKSFNDSAIKEQMEIEIVYQIQKLDYKLLEDADSEKRRVEIDVNINVAIKGNEILPLRMINDAYSTKNEVEILKEEYKIEKFLEKLTFQVEDGETFEISGEFPTVSELYDKRVLPTISEIKIEKGKVFVEGLFDITLSCLSKNHDNPLFIIKKNSKFQKTFSIPNLGDDILCDAKIEITSTDFFVKNREISGKYVAKIDVNLIKVHDIKAISEISIDNEKNIKKCKDIKIYFVKKGDNLWQIAKKYKTTVDELKLNNNLESDLIFPGQQLLVCA